MMMIISRVISSHTGPVYIVTPCTIFLETNVKQKDISAEKTDLNFKTYSARHN